MLIKGRQKAKSLNEAKNAESKKNDTMNVINLKKDQSANDYLIQVIRNRITKWNEKNVLIKGR